MIANKFKESSIEVLKEGDLDGPTIDEKKYIDQHYYAVSMCQSFIAVHH